MASRHQRKCVVLFDLDGTLVDSAPDLAAALNRLLAEIGRDSLPLPDIKPMIGDGIAKMVERGLDATGGRGEALARHVDRFRDIYEGMLAVRTRPYPGVTETLAALRDAGCRLGVVTNKPERASRKLLSALGLAEFFAAIAGGDSYPVRKPDPGHLLNLLGEMQARPADAVMVGDSAHDVAAARGANMPVILMSYGYGATPDALHSADEVLDDFAAIPGTLERLSR